MQNTNLKILVMFNSFNINIISIDNYFLISKLIDAKINKISIKKFYCYSSGKALNPLPIISVLDTTFTKASGSKMRRFDFNFTKSERLNVT